MSHDFKRGEMVKMYSGAGESVVEVFNTGLDSFGTLEVMDAEGDTFSAHPKQLERFTPCCGCPESCRCHAKD